MIGLDTGFFLKILEGSEQAVQVWRRVFEGEDDAICSALTLFELERLALKGRVSREGNDTLQKTIPGVCKIFWLRDKDSMYLAARMSHGLGIPAIDSIILAGFIREEVREIYTTDRHFESYKKKGVKVTNLGSK